METDETIVTSEGDETRERERMSVVATFGILAATIAATLAGSLAALASFHGGDADAQRQAWATYSNELLLGYNQEEASGQQSVDIAVENAWRAQLFRTLAAEESDPTLSAELLGEAALSPAGSNVSEAPPSFTSPSPTAWCQGLHAPLDKPFDCAYEVASSYAATSLDDNRQERAYIACVSLLAIALFLFALSKMLSQPSMEKLFLGLGALVTLIAVGWMAAEPLLTPAPAPSGSAIRSYERGWQDEQNGVRPPSTAEALLRAATSGEPTFADAWQQLGNEELYDPGGGRPGHHCPEAVAALTQALSLRGSSEDRDRLAVGEALCGEPLQALSTLRDAPTDPSDVLAGPAVALAQLASGRVGPAMASLHNAVWHMAIKRVGAYGSIFMSQWFDQLFTEVDALEKVDAHRADVDAFKKRMQREEALVTLAEFGLRAPLPASHGSVSVIPTPVPPGTADHVEAEALVLHYSGLREGDVVSLVWRETTPVLGERFISSPSVPNASLMVVGHAGAPPAGTGVFTVPALDFVTSGHYQLDVTLDATPFGPPIALSVKTGSGSSVPPPATSEGPSACPTGPTTTTTFGPAFTC